MNTELHLMPVYENNLDTTRLAQLFNNTSQGYKFYWFEAVLKLIIKEERDFTFREIIEEMICEAWHTVVFYHLRLGPTVNDNAENFLEHAIKKLSNLDRSLALPGATKEKIKEAIKRYEREISRDMSHLADYVPYKLLYPFFEADNLREGLSYIKKDQHARLIAYMSGLSTETKLLYVIIDGISLEKKIRVNQYWRKLLVKNYDVIHDWIQFNKAQYLQDRNPGVPGIVNKLCFEEENIRRLNQARELWKATVSITGNPIREIYTGSVIPFDKLSIDHFVPRSFVSNDELWNLIPMNRGMNSSKNNRLPSWEDFFEPFAQYQYYLYGLVFPQNIEDRKPIMIDCFKKCRKNNLNAIWALEKLYVSGNSEEQFVNILQHNLKPIYETAYLQGYDIWQIERQNCMRLQ